MAVKVIQTTGRYEMEPGTNNFYARIVRPLLTGFVLVCFGLYVTGCSKEEDPRPAASTESAPPATSDSAQSPTTIGNFSVESIARGALVFQQRCAECHGPQGQGHPDWSADRKAKPVVAPPLDGTGIVQRLSRKKLEDIIRHGIVRDKVPVMPAWQGRLNQQELEDVITWFQAIWPPDIYRAWQAKNSATSPQAAK